MPTIQSNSGTVTGLRGTALRRGADGKMHPLKIGDLVTTGDVILTSQDGIVEIDSPPGASRTAKPAQGDEIDRVITGLNEGDPQAAPAAGLAGGGDGNLQEGLRVERISEALTPTGFFQNTVARTPVVLPESGRQEEEAPRTTPPGLSASSGAISAFEQGAQVSLGLPVPRGAGAGATVTIDRLPALGEIHKADGSLVTAGTVLSPADLPGLVYVPPADYVPGTPVGEFSYTVTSGTAAASGTVSVNLTAVNDTPLASPAVASGLEDGSIPVALGGTDVDGRVTGVTVTRLPPGSTLFLADGATPVGVGQTLTPAQAANLLFRPAADFTGGAVIGFTVTDDSGATSAPASVVVTVSAVNDAPIANLGSAGSGLEDQPVPVRLGGTDVDGTVVSVSVTALPGNGVLYRQDGVTPVVAGTALTPAQAAHLVFAPAADFNGPSSITFTVTDNLGSVSAPVTAQITVAPVNDAPAASADTATALEDAPVSGNVLANDSDIDGPALALSRFSVGAATYTAGSTATLPGVGTLVMLADGSYTFTPAPDFNGAVPLVSYTTTDGAATSSATLTLNVMPQNDAPIAVDDLASTPINAPLTIAVLANDRDVDGDPLTVTGATLANPAQGTVSVNPGGTLAFTPAADFAGQVLISYSVADASGAVSTASVTVNVGTNTPPSGADATRTIAEDGSYTLQAADVGFADADAGQSFANLRIDALAAAGRLLLDGVAVTAGQLVSATAIAAGRLVFQPTADGNGTPYAAVSFSVQDSAGAFASTPSTLGFNVTPVNDAPVARADVALVTEDTPASGNVLANDSDVEGSALSITQFSIGGTAFAAGSLATLPGIGSLVMRPDGTYTFTPASNYFGAVPAATYTVSDGSATSTATLTLNVRAINDAPTLVADVLPATEDTPVVLNVLSNDGDADGDPLTITQVAGQPIAVGAPVALPEGSVALNADGTLTFTPNPNFNGPVNFSYTVFDGTASSTAGVTVNVAAVNDAPEARNDLANTPINTPTRLAVLANDTDADADLLSVSSATLANPALGSIVVNADGTVGFTPASNVAGPVVVNYTITDPSGASSSASVTVFVGANTPPSGSDATLSINEDSGRSFGAADFGFTDADLGQSLAGVRIDTLPAFGLLTLGGVAVVAGEVINAADFGSLIFTPAANANGTAYASFTFSVQDSAGGFDTTPNTFSVNVTAQPDAAVIGGQTASATVEDNQLVANGTLTVNDPDAGEAGFIAQASVAGAHGSFSVDATGDWTYTLNNADPAVQALGAGQSLPNETFTVRTIDGTAQIVTVTITGTDDAPVISSGSGAVTENTQPSVSGLLSANDVDNPALAFNPGTVSGAYGSLVLAATGAWTYTLDGRAEALPGGQTVSDTITVILNDGSTTTVTLSVSGSNDAAVITGTSIGSVSEDGSVNAGGTLVASDVDSPAGFSAASSAGTYGDFSITATGVWAYVLRNADANVQALTSAQHPTESFVVSTADGTTQTITVTINGTNEAPVGVASPATGLEDAAGIPITLTGSDIDGSIASFTIGTLPANGVLYFGTTPLGIGSVIPASAGGATLSFVPNANWNGSTTLSFSATDNEGSASATVTQGITVQAVNDAPLAAPDLASTPINTPLNNFNVLANDSDVDGNPLSVTGASVGAAFGTVSVNPDGSLNFTPANNFTGPVTISYTLSDGQGGSSTGTLTVNVGANTAPSGSDATLTVDEDTSRTFNAADFGFTDADLGQTLAAVRIDAVPTAGALSLNGVAVTAGQVINAADFSSLVFTPAANGNGAAYASFTFSVQDSAGGFDGTPNTIGFNVTPQPDAAVIGGQTSGAAVEDSPLVASGTLTVTDPDGALESAFTAQAAVAGAHGSFSIDAAGVWTYTLDNADPAVQALGAGQTLPNETFTVRTVDGTTQVVSVSISGTNDGPVAAAAAAGATEDASPVTGSVGATDVDANAVLSFALNAAAPAGLIFNANGTYSFNPADPAYQSLAAGQTQAITVPYTVTDDHGATSTANLVITLTGTDDVPTISGALSGAVQEDSTLTSSGTLIVSDPDQNQSGFVVQSNAAGTYGSFSMSAAGTWTYTLNNAAANVQALGATASVTDSFVVTTLDGTTRTVVVTVSGTNDAPVAVAASFAGTEDAAVVNGSVTATDVDTGAVLAFALVNPAPAGLSFNSNGTYSFNPAHPAYQSLGAGQSQVITVQYRVTDDQGATSAANLVITVTGTNDTPVAVADIGLVNENATLMATVATGVLANDTDVDTGDSQTVSSVSFGATPGTVGSGLNGTYGTLTLNADGSYSYSANRPAADALVAGAVVAESFTYTLRDTAGAASTTTLVFTITGTNDAPTITGPLTGTVKEDTTLTSTGTLVVSDLDAGQSNFVVQSGTPGTYGSFSLISTGTWTYTLNNAGANVQSLGASASVTDSFTVTTTDGTTRTVVVTVDGTNDAPVAIAANFSVAEDAAIVNGTVTATDVDTGVVLAFALVNPAPAGLTFNSNGTYSFNAANAAYQSLGVGQSQVITVQYRVTDDQGAASTANLVITVTGTNDAPVAVADIGSVNENASLTATAATGVLNNDTDADSGDTKVVSAISFGATAGTVGTALNGTYGTLTLNADGSYSYSANRTAADALVAGAIVTEAFSYTVRDTAGATASTTLTFTVTGTNDAPTITGPLTGSVKEDTTLTSTGTLVVSDPDAGQSNFVVQSGTPGTYGSFSLTSAGTWTYTLNNAAANVQALAPAASVTDSFTVTTADGTTRTVVVTVSGTNDAPVAVAASLMVTEDAAIVNGSVTATDVDTGAVLAFALVNPAPAGLSFNSNGTYSFNAANAAYQSLGIGQSVVITVPYTVTDDQGATSTASLVITVTGTNDMPVAAATSFSVAEDAAVITGAVTASDADANATLVFALNGAAPAGLSFNGDGSYAFNPADPAYQSLGVGQSQVITVPYTVSDDQGATSTANLVITVNGTNDAPVAVAANFTVAEDAAIVNGSVTATDVDTGAVLSFALVNPAPAGLSFNSNGTYSFNAANSAYQSLGAGQSQVITVAYRVTDDQGATSTANLVITVTGTNDTPVAVTDTGSVNENATLTAAVAAGVLANDTDVDTGDTKTVLAVSFGATAGTIGSGLNGTYGTLTLNADGSYSYSASRPAADALVAGATVTESFTYTVRDTAGATSSTTLTFTITGTNDAPTITGPLTGSVKEDTTVTSTGSLVIADADAGQSNFMVQSGTIGTYGSFSLTSTGTWTYTLNNAAANVQALGATATVTDSFTVTTADGTTRTVVVTVSGTNDAPVAVAANFTVAEDAATVNGSVSATDVDTGAVLAFALVNPAPAGLTFSSNGTYSFNAANAAYQSLGVGQSQVITVPYTVTDDQGAASTTNLVITVTGTNDAPVAVADIGSVNENATLTATVGAGVLANDTDVDIGDTKTVSAVSFGATPGAVGTGLNGTYGTLTLNADGSYSYSANRPAADALVAGAVVSESFSYTVRDTAGTTSTTTLIFTVTGTNDAPTITGPLTGSVKEDTTLTSTGSLVIADPDAGQSSFVVQSGTPGTYGSFSLSAAGTWTYMLNNAAANVQSLGATASVTDSFVVTTLDGTTRTVVVTVSGTNDAPVAVAASFTVAEGAALINGSVTATDVDTGAVLAFALVNPAPVGLTFNSNGTYSFNAANAAYQSLGLGQSQVITVAYRVTDDQGATSTANLVITVTGTNDAPVAVADIGSVSENATLTATAATGVLNNDTDVDSGDTKVVSAISFGATAGTIGSGLNGTYGTLTLNADGSYSYSANRPAADALVAGATVTESFSYTVRDTAGATANTTLTFTITGTNDAPTITGPLTGSVKEDTTLTSTGTLVIADPDAGQSSFVVQSGTPGTYGSFSLTSTGTWTYTLNNAAANVQALGATTAAVTDSFTVTTADGTTRTVVVTVNGTNDAPVANTNSAATNEDTALTLTPAALLGNDTDVDAGDVLSISSVQAAVGGSVLINGSGNVVFTPTANYSGPASFTYTISDGHGGTSTATVNVTIAAVTDAPTLVVSPTIFALTPSATTISTEPGITQANLEATLGLAAGKLDTFDPVAGPTTSDPGTVDVLDGKLTNYTVSLGTNNKASFNWQFFNGENSVSEINNGFNDLVVLVITDPTGAKQFVQLSSSEQVGANTNGAAVDASGTYTYTAAAAGEYQFSWLVLNGKDPDKDSSISVTAPTVTVGANTYGAPVGFPIGVELVDKDGSETLAVSVSGMPAGAAFSAGTDLGGGVWSFTSAQLDGLQLYPSAGFTGTLNLSVTATSTETSTGTSASTTQAVAVTFDSTTTSTMGSQNADTLAGTAGNDQLQGFAGDDTLNGNDGNDLIYGDAGNDIINGGNGNDILYGGAGTDTLVGGAGNDKIHGGAGSDSLTGGTGADVFAWTLADRGTSLATLPTDTITDFSIASPAAGGDLLDLRDLLQGEAKAGVSAGNLQNYLDFDTTTSAGNTIIHVSRTGGFSGGVYSAAAEDQRIVLTGVDVRSLATFGLTSTATDNDIINQLLQRGKLITDGA